MPMVRSLIALALLFLIAPPAIPGAAFASDEPVALSIALRRLGPDPAPPGRDSVDQLAVLDSWQLSSTNPHFGGISAIAVDGNRLVMLSDDAMLVGTVFDPTATTLEAVLIPVAGVTGSGKEARDSESMAIDPETGTRWIGFERSNSIARYSGSGVVEARAIPAAMADWPVNGGPEAMVRLGDGRFIVFAEEAPGPDGSTAALLFDRDPTDPAAVVTRFGYRAPAGHRITDAALLPDGNLVLLNRRYTALEGVSIIVTRVASTALPGIGAGAGSVITGNEIARFAPPMAIDNMEALAIDEQDGRTVIWMMSDDNFSALQRTLLLRLTFVQ